MKSLFTIFTVFVFVMPAHAQYNGGTGAPDDPYQIATAEDLMLLSNSPEDYDKHFNLTADIDLDPNLPGCKVFDRAVIAPDMNDGKIGFQGTPFTGVFEGNGFTIRRLIIAGESYIGLFGELEVPGEVWNLGVMDANIHLVGERAGILLASNHGEVANCFVSGRIQGNDLLGGLVGINGGVVRASFSTGQVSGNFLVGGLIGFNGSTLYNSYSMCTVDGNQTVGGLVGNNHSAFISNCYSVGTVKGGDHSIGGLVGNTANRARTVNSFWDIEASGQTTSEGGMGKTTAEMLTANTFIDAGWDFVKETRNGHEDIWWILEGQSYPRLWWQYGRAFSPYPQDGVLDVTQPFLLSWFPGGSGLWHDVYFSEDKEAMTNATTESTEVYCGRQVSEMTTFDTGPLKLDKTYYWRIDEVNEAHLNNPWKGDVWSFTTADYLIVDDFESYIDADDDISKSIWYTWIDGFIIPENGAMVGYCELSWNWRGPKRIHGGEQSMDIYYDHSGTAYYSEAIANTADLVIGKDWTLGGVELLSLWFYGDPNNTSEPMYVGLSNAKGPTAAVYHNNPDAVLINEWTQWQIDLQEFEAQGMNLTNINSISIGFGDKNNPQSGGTGLVFFDDIRLYRSRSVISYDSEVNEP